MKLLKRFKNSEQGSVTIFVLSSLLVVLLTMIVIYGNMTNKLSSQAEQIRKIQDEYSEDYISKMRQEYDKIIGDTEEPKVNKTELIALIERAKKTARENWTLDSWEKLQQEIVTAEGVVENIHATQEDVDGSIIDLTGAMNNLKRLDKASLEKMITKAQEIWNNKEKYYPDSIQGMDEKLERGKKIFNSVDVTQKQVDDIKNELMYAVFDARLKPN